MPFWRCFLQYNIFKFKKKNTALQKITLHVAQNTILGNNQICMHLLILLNVLHHLPPFSRKCTMKYKQVYIFYFCCEALLLMKDMKSGEYFRLSFIISVAITKTCFQHKSEDITTYKSYAVRFCSSYAKFLQDPIGNYSFTFSFKGYILIYNKHSHGLKEKKKNMGTGDGEGSWENWGTWEFSLCATHTFWWGCETISLWGANGSACSRFTQLGHWKPGCKSPGYAAQTLTCGWCSLASITVMGERVGDSDVAEKEKQTSLKGLSDQLCCTIPPRDPVLSSWVIREACFEKGGCDGTNTLWLLLPCRIEVPLQANIATMRKGSVGATQPGLGVEELPSWFL